MARDPCRRFTLGATIEDSRMKLWIYNRSMIIASDAFDLESVSYFISNLNDHQSFAYDASVLGYKIIYKSDSFPSICRR